MNTIDRVINPDFQSDKSVLVLSLKKQHYLDSYQGPMTGMYSCFGYYDAIDILFPSRNSSFFQKKSNIQISPIWYGMGELIETQTGRFSQQNIGLFSIADSTSTDASYYNLFWGEHSGSPYFAVGFIRLINITDYKSVAKNIMKLSFKKGDEYVTAVVYYTYDNTDLVVLLRGNSISQISNVMRKMEHFRSVYYLHSILGVSEEYLKECKRQENGMVSIPESWNNISCHIDECIKEVEMRVSVSGGLFNPSMIRGFFEKYAKNLKGLENATIAYIQGHESLCIRIPKTDVKGVLSLISDQGFCTHENGLYGNGIINIETCIIVNDYKIRDLGNLDPPSSSSQSGSITPWASSLMGKYSHYMNLAWDKKNEALYSCFLGMRQTLNTLSQYEGFRMSKDIFYMLFPGFDMYDNHLTQGLAPLYPQPHGPQEITDEDSEEFDSALMEKICKFTMAVNQVIYHTIHTDQVFLMVPGYAGASYSIPIRLCMFYLHLSDLIINALNDSNTTGDSLDTKYKYSILFVPEMEERPSSALLDFNIDNNNRIIIFNVSQRALYLPRHFIIILTHELAHYVGVFIREREKRRDCIINILSEVISYEIMPDEIWNCKKSSEIVLLQKIRLFFITNYKQTIIDSCKQFLYGNRSGGKSITKTIKTNVDEGRLHADSLESELLTNCLIFLTDKQGIRKIIADIPNSYINQLESIYQESKGYTYVEFMTKVGQCQSEMLANCEDLLANDEINTLLRVSVFPLFKEIFSDTAARCLLSCDKGTYMEAFNISEGYVHAMEPLPDISAVGAEMFPPSYIDHYRQYIINKVFSESTSSGPDHVVEAVNLKMPACYEKELVSYAEECKNSIDRRLNLDNEAKNAVSKLRKIFNLFLNADHSRNEIYETIVDSIKSFQEKINMEYEERCKDIRNSTDNKP